jgi:hypothetical protein
MMRKSWLTFTTLASSLFFAGFAHAQDLQAPPPMDPNAVGPQTQTQPQQPQTETTQTLNESETEDSGRGLEFFYLNGGVNASYVGLDTFSNSQLGVNSTKHLGPAFDLGLGLRLLIITIGPRVRFSPLSAFNLWQIDGEAALHVPIGALDIWIGAHGGYALAGALNAPNDTTVHGLDLGADFGIDYYLTKNFSIGGDASGGFFFLKRPSISGESGVYAIDGSSVGFGALVGARVGFHL